MTRHQVSSIMSPSSPIHSTDSSPVTTNMPQADFSDTPNSPLDARADHLDPARLATYNSEMVRRDAEFFMARLAKKVDETP
jgi:hypothetical protein